VQRVEDAARLAVRGLDQLGERFERILLLARLDLERPGDHDFRHAILSPAEGGDATRKGSPVSLRINHVSINALDLQRSTDFYVELLGAEPIATPNFGIPVQWLAVGRTQLHLFERDLTPTSHHHFGITVDDVEPVYRAAERWNAFDDEAFRNRLVELPGDVVQLYLRDPAGNLLEVDHHGVDRLPADLRARLAGLWEFNPQDDEQMSARLFVPE
jgi:catechol 2,3-dioxygenase-like lactoylglutathione lyase family enzyme